MKGDFTRLTFDPTKHYRGVLMQQGRVTLDSDWNEQVQIAEHRYSTFFGDFVGQSGTSGKDAFRIVEVDDNRNLCIRAGHYYIDGLLVENDADVLYDNQLGVALPSDDGMYIFYLDVWSRHVTTHENPDLREAALGGPDTATRIKTEWQVRWQPVRIENLGEVKKEAYAPGWKPYPALGTMTLSVMRDERFGLQPDNCLYRVELHDVHPTPTFVWSSDNGAIAARVKLPLDGVAIILDETEQRVSKMFPRGSWIEVTDEEHALKNEPGLFAHVDDVDGSKLTVKWPESFNPSQRSWSEPVIVRLWPTAPINIDFSKWYPLGNRGIQVRFDLDQPRVPPIDQPHVPPIDQPRVPPIDQPHVPPIDQPRVPPIDQPHVPPIDQPRVPPGAGPAFPPVYYRTGDYWLIPARAGVGLDWNSAAARPPHGVEHHYAALGLVRKKGDRLELVDDLRTSFQPLTSGNVSKRGDTIDGDLCVRGRVAIGTCNYGAPLKISARALDGALLSFEDAQTNEAWRIIHSDGDATNTIPAALSVTSGKRDGEQPTNYLTILDNGNVGIGTPDPASKLEISVPAGSNQVGLGLRARAAGWGSGITLENEHLYGIRAKGTEEGGELEVRNLSSGRVNLLIHGSTDHISLAPQGGNVGIGTVNPGAKLEINGGDLLFKANENYPSDPGDIIFQDLSGGQKARIWSDPAAGRGLRLCTNQENRPDITIDANGNVGIGKEDPQCKLDVEGDLAVQGDLAVTGSLSSLRWRVTEVCYSGSIGPLPVGYNRDDFAFQANGGTLVFFASGTGYTGIANSQIGMQIWVGTEGETPKEVGTTKLYANEANSHKSFPVIFSLRKLPAGSYFVQLVALPGTLSDDNDFFSFIIMEFPF